VSIDQRKQPPDQGLRNYIPGSLRCLGSSHGGGTSSNLRGAHPRIQCLNSCFHRSAKFLGVGCSVTFLLVRWLLDILRLGPSPDQKGAEIALLRHQLAVQRRQVAPLSTLPDRSRRAGHSGQAAQPGALGRLPGQPDHTDALAPGPRRPVLDVPSKWPIPCLSR
jgi:hypothetical protein